MVRILLISLVGLLAMTSRAGAAVTYNVVNDGAVNYLFDGIADPVLTLTRGETYIFNLNAPGHPFYIKTVQGTGTGNAYNDGVTNNGVDVGTITFVVPPSAPSLLFYNCSVHAGMTNQINVIDPVPGTSPWSVAALVLLVGSTGLVALRRRARA